MGTMRVLVPLVATMVGCSAVGHDGDGSAPGRAGGKADEATEACKVSGTFEVLAGSDTFSRWTFTLEDGALTDSHTGDRTAREWPTHLLVAADDPSRMTLVQITDAPDAILETTLHLRATDCASPTTEFEVVGAYEIFFTMTSEGASTDSVHRLNATVTRVGGDAVSDEQAALNATVRTALAAAGVDRLPFTFDVAEVRRQEALMPHVLFEQALRAALKSFLEDGEDAESPLAIVGYSDEEGPAAWERSACPGAMEPVVRVRCFMNLPDSHLEFLPIGEAGEGGDPVDANRWVFSMYLGSLSDHGHWAEVSRHTAAAFNWGFN